MRAPLSLATQVLSMQITSMFSPWQRNESFFFFKSLLSAAVRMINDMVFPKENTLICKGF